MKSTDVTDSPLVRPTESLTVADEIAFDNFNDEQKRVARLVVREEIEEEVLADLAVDDTETVKELEMQNFDLTSALDYMRGEGIERIYKNSKGFWLYPKDEKGGVTYDSYKSAGPFPTLEKAIHAGTK